MTDTQTQRQSQSLTRRTCALSAPQLDFILLDGSSSMNGQAWWQALGAIDRYVGKLRDGGHHGQVVVATFDSTDVLCVQRDQTLAEWTPLSQAPIGAYWGKTPLYDAINAVGRQLHEMKPERAHIVIVTDGEENASITSAVQATAVLAWMKAKGYQVTFLGAEFNNAAQARFLGVDPACAIGVSSARLGDAAERLAVKRLAHARSGEGIHFSEGERQQFGGFLSGPSGPQAGDQ